MRPATKAGLMVLPDTATPNMRPVLEWFDTPRLKWALCPWSEAAFLRYATRENRISMSKATGILEDLAQSPGYRYHPIEHDWRTLTKPFLHRLHGHKQITDACLLGLAIRDNLILVTFDRAILHMAGKNSGKAGSLSGLSYSSLGRHRSKAVSLSS